MYHVSGDMVNSYTVSGFIPSDTKRLILFDPFFSPSRQGLIHSRWAWSYLTGGDRGFLTLLRVSLVLESTGIRCQMLCSAGTLTQGFLHTRQVFHQLSYIPALLDLFCMKKSGLGKAQVNARSMKAGREMLCWLWSPYFGIGVPWHQASVWSLSSSQVNCCYAKHSVVRCYCED